MIFNGFSTGVRKVALFFGYLGSIAMCLMAVIVTVDVSGRFLFNKPLRGGIEIVEELMVCVIFLMLAYVTEKEKHIKVDIFISRGRSFEESQFKRAERLKIFEDLDRTAYFSSAEDIILSKLDFLGRTLETNKPC